MRLPSLFVTRLRDQEMHVAMSKQKFDQTERQVRVHPVSSDQCGLVQPHTLAALVLMGHCVFGAA